MKIAIFGKGLSGLAAEQLIKKIGIECVVFDEKTGPIFENANEYSVVVYSPGFHRNHIWRKKAIESECLCMTEIDFASIFWPGKIIAITGTNGKTTLTEFLSFAFKRIGKSAFAVGNNGYSFCRVFENLENNSTFLESGIERLKSLVFKGLQNVSKIDEKHSHENINTSNNLITRDSVAFCEVSSYQAEDLKYFSPSAVLWTNFEPDHLDVHKNLTNYFMAKARLLQKNLGFAIVGKSVFDFWKNSEKSDFFNYFNSSEFSQNNSNSVQLTFEQFNQLQVSDDLHVINHEKIEEIPVGEFDSYPQRENFFIAREFWRLFNLRLSDFYSAAESFKLPFARLKKIATVRNLSFWNDSKSTNYSSLSSALKNFKTKVVWIGGGKSKDENLADYAELVKDRISEAFLLGETAKELKILLDKKNISTQIFDSIESCVLNCKKFLNKESKTDILLSPGFSSLDMFKDYEERGKKFENAIYSVFANDDVKFL